MELTDFGNFKTWKITDEKTKQNLFSIISPHVKSDNRNMFPGAHPVSIERKHFEQLRKEPYWVCAKSDGIRFLFICLTYETKPYSFFLNRSNDIFLLNCNNENGVYKSTILDGEMIYNWKYSRFDYVTYDAVVVNGIHVADLHHSERLKHAYSAIQHITNAHNIFFDIKQFYPLKDIKHYYDNVIPNLFHKTDGLIFTPEELPVTNGTHFKLFKWKECYDNTVDFSVHRNIKGNNPKYILKITKGKYLNSLFENTLHLDMDMETQVDEHIRTHESCILECKYLYPNNWKGVLIRKDKTYPNNALTYNKTLLNIKENIQLDEFFNLIVTPSLCA